MNSKAEFTEKLRQRRFNSALNLAGFIFFLLLGLSMFIMGIILFGSACTLTPDSIVQIGILQMKAQNAMLGVLLIPGSGFLLPFTIGFLEGYAIYSRSDKQLKQKQGELMTNRPAPTQNEPINVTGKEGCCGFLEWLSSPGFDNSSLQEVSSKDDRSSKNPKNKS